MRISDWSSDVCSSDLLAGGVGSGPDAMPVHLEDDLLHEIEGQEADERARAPAVLVERQLHDLGLLLLQIYEKRRLVLAPVVDIDRHANAVAARKGDEVPGGETEWRANVAGTLLCTPATNQLREGSRLEERERKSVG